MNYVNRVCVCVCVSLPNTNCRTGSSHFRLSLGHFTTRPDEKYRERLKFRSVATISRNGEEEIVNHATILFLEYISENDIVVLHISS